MATTLSELDWRIIVALQEGLPLSPKPYAELAHLLGIDEKLLLTYLIKMHSCGILKRIGGVLNHRQAGVSANALCVWHVPPERLDEVGEALSDSPHVTHCYARTPLPEWPYNLYAMLHATTRGECDAVADELERRLHLPPRRAMYSSREWKKASLGYYDNATNS